VNTLQNRYAVLKQLKQNPIKANNRMKQYTDT
jgi:hypothetical protein